MMKNINFLDHPYWIPKCLNVGRISIPWQIFSYIYFPQIFTDIGWMFENVKIPIDHHAIFLFYPFQNLLILSHLSESFDVPAGCNRWICSFQEDPFWTVISHHSTVMFLNISLPFIFRALWMKKHFTLASSEWFGNESTSTASGPITTPLCLVMSFPGLNCIRCPSSRQTWIYFLSDQKKLKKKQVNFGSVFRKSC